MAHIPDGVLSLPVLVGGAVLAAGGLALGLRRLEDAEIPKTAILAAMFFVASLIAVPVGPSSVHLLLAGPMGLVLGARAFVRRTSRHTLRTLGHFAGRMLVRSLERAERVDEAMRCRGFAGRFALVVGETFSRLDLGFVVLVSIGLTAALVVEHFA